MASLRRPRPIQDLRAYQVPAWVMFAWVGWLLGASIAFGLLYVIGVPQVLSGILLVAGTVVVFIRTWGKYGHRVEPETDRP